MSMYKYIDTYYVCVYIYICVYVCVCSPSRAYPEATGGTLTLKYVVMVIWQRSTYMAKGPGICGMVKVFVCHRHLSMSRRISNFTMVGSSLNWCSSTCPKLVWAVWVSWHWKMMLSGTSCQNFLLFNNFVWMADHHLPNGHVAILSVGKSPMFGSQAHW